MSIIRGEIKSFNAEGMGKNGSKVHGASSTPPYLGLENENAVNRFAFHRMHRSEPDRYPIVEEYVARILFPAIVIVLLPFRDECQEIRHGSPRRLCRPSKPVMAVQKAFHCCASQAACPKTIWSLTSRLTIKFRFGSIAASVPASVRFVTRLPP